MKNILFVICFASGAIFLATIWELLNPLEGRLMVLWSLGCLPVGLIYGFYAPKIFPWFFK